MKGTYETDVIMDDGTVIQTTLTFSGDAVKAFLREVVSKHGHFLFVGIDTGSQSGASSSRKLGAPRTRWTSRSSAWAATASPSGTSTLTIYSD
ncbi:unnamed protein product [Urochloa humidicola]